MSSPEEKKLAVLAEISKTSRVLFAMGRKADVRARRDSAWILICEFAYSVGLTENVCDGDRLRRDHINRWRSDFRVRIDCVPHPLSDEIDPFFFFLLFPG